MFLRSLLAMLLAGCLTAPVACAEDGPPEDGEAQSAEEDHEGPQHADKEHEGGDHATGDGEVNPLATDPDLAIWTLVVFIGLLFVLKQVAWEPITNALEAREAGISDNIAAAAAKHEEAKKLLSEHQAKIDAAAEEVRGMLEEARRDAEATKGQIVAEARDAADAERKRALREIELAKEGAVKGLAEHSANLAIDLATRVVRQEISQDRQNEIAREALAEMISTAPSNN